MILKSVEFAQIPALAVSVVSRQEMSILVCSDISGQLKNYDHMTIKDLLNLNEGHFGQKYARKFQASGYLTHQTRAEKIMLVTWEFWGA